MEKTDNQTFGFEIQVGKTGHRGLRGQEARLKAGQICLPLF